jgi:hypothetical protein
VRGLLVYGFSECCAVLASAIKLLQISIALAASHLAVGALFARPSVAPDSANLDAGRLQQNFPNSAFWAVPERSLNLNNLNLGGCAT